MSIQRENLSLEVLNTWILEEVPSASGIIKSGETYYVIGDDSPFLFSLDKEFKLVSKTPIYSTEHLAGEKIMKAVKPDFEALEMVAENEVLVFGSGSKSPQRDICVRFSPDNPQEFRTYNLSPFYENLKKLKILENRELNLEAVAYRQGKIYLFNRGKNVIFCFDHQQLMDHFEGLIPFPQPGITLFELPSINGIEAGFSGATAFQDQPYLLFTASIENTANAYDDGEILGSFVGLIPIADEEISNSFKSVIIPFQDTALKVESVTIDEEISEGETSIILATDSDGGKSLVLKCILKW